MFQNALRLARNSNEDFYRRKVPVSNPNIALVSADLFDKVLLWNCLNQYEHSRLLEDMRGTGLEPAKLSGCDLA